ncbi:MAG: recombinase family protein [Armatimonadota bacterium]
MRWNCQTNRSTATRAYPEHGWCTRSLFPGHGCGLNSRIVDRCLQGGVEALVIDTIDRLGRDPYVCMGIQRHLEPYGTRVLVADGDHDFSNPEDELVLTVQMGIARSEIQKMSRRSTRAQAERRAAGYPPWGKLPFGWRWLTEEEFRASGEPFKGIARVDAEADWVRWIFDQYLRRRRVILDICAELNDRAVPFRDSDLAWQAWRVREVMDKFTHAGLVQDNEGELCPGVHFEQRIIDPDVWRAVQDLRAERSTRGPRALSQRDAPLLGIIRCGACGRRLQLHRDREETVYYVCPKPQEGEDRVCPGVNKRTDTVETAVADFIRQRSHGKSISLSVSEVISEDIVVPAIVDIHKRPALHPGGGDRRHIVGDEPWGAKVVEDAVVPDDAVFVRCLRYAACRPGAVAGPSHDVGLKEDAATVPHGVIAAELIVQHIRASNHIVAVVDGERVMSGASGRVALEDHVAAVKDVHHVHRAGIHAVEEVV